MLAPAIDTGRSQPFREACTDSSVIANRNAHNTGGGVLLQAQSFSKQLHSRQRPAGNPIAPRATRGGNEFFIKPAFAY
jgi:hypothetical protein